MKYAIPNDQIKHEITENMALKRPPYTEPYQHIRSSYEPTAMLKYPPAPGAPLMPPALPQDLKYTQPVDMKYKPPENLSKTQFSADNLVKGYLLTYLLAGFQFISKRREKLIQTKGNSIIILIFGYNVGNLPSDCHMDSRPASTQHKRKAWKNQRQKVYRCHIYRHIQALFQC